MLVARNSDVSDHTITFTTIVPDTVGTVIKATAGTAVVTVPAGKSIVLGPFNRNVYGQDGASAAVVTFKASDATVKVFAQSVKTGRVHTR